MATDVIMPALGMAQTTGLVVAWMKQAGAQVTKGEPLLEVETDKAVVDVEGPASGTLTSISAEAGSEVPVGTAIAVILGAGENASLQPDSSQPEVGRRRPAATQVSAQSAPSEARLRPASPLARRLAAEGGVDLAAVAGAGPDGAVQAADLPRAVADRTELEVGRIWRIMAERTAAAWEAPHFYLMREAMAEPLLAFRAGLAGKGERVTVTDVLPKPSTVTL